MEVDKPKLTQIWDLIPTEEEAEFSLYSTTNFLLCPHSQLCSTTWRMRMRSECLAMCQAVDKMANPNTDHGIPSLLIDCSTVGLLIKEQHSYIVRFILVHLSFCFASFCFASFCFTSFCFISNAFQSHVWNQVSFVSYKWQQIVYFY